MNYRKLLIATMLLVFISGCSDFMMICSLNPFYLDKDIVLAPEIEGNWMVHPIRAKTNSESKNNANWEAADTTSVWRIKRFVSEEKIKNARGKDSTVFKPQNFYRACLSGAKPDSSRYQFRVTLFRIDGALYADFRPGEITDISNSRMAQENILTVHTLARIEMRHKQLFVSWLGADYMKEMIEKKRVRIKFRYVPDAGRLLLTAPSEDLTEMLERYATQKRFIDWENQPAMLQLNQIK